MKKIAFPLLFAVMAGTVMAAPNPAPTPAPAVGAPVKSLDVTGWTTPKPPYPESARKAKLAGSVRLRVYTDHYGKVKKAVVVQSSGHKELDDATVAFALANWKGPRFDRAVFVQNFSYAKKR